MNQFEHVICGLQLMILTASKFLFVSFYHFSKVIRLGWRRDFVHVAEFAELIAFALNGAVIAEKRAEFAATTAQVLTVHQHVVAPQCDNGINFGIVCIFRDAMEQVLVQLQ